MNFKYYEILSFLVPGFIIYQLLSLTIQTLPNVEIMPSLAIAFVLGYFVNAISSWMENILFLTFGGKPSINLLKGKRISKVVFHEQEKVIRLLKQEVEQESDENKMFSVAMRYANQSENERVENFNAIYGFSRVLLLTTLIAFLVLSFKFYDNYLLYVIMLPLIFISWQRCKERSYYYAKEVLDTYLKLKNE
jgi:hypothetical protein